jgi:hypothetical protein
MATLRPTIIRQGQAPDISQEIAALERKEQKRREKLIGKLVAEAIAQGRDPEELIREYLGG